jgi:transporter family-2 protein
MRPILFALAAVAGVAAACQAAANAALSSRAGLGAALFLNAVVVLAGTGVLLLFTGGPRALAALGGAPVPHYIAGLCGFVIIAGLALALPRLGAGTALSLMVLGQGAMALVIDHFGLWGVRAVGVSGPRLLGVALLVAGVALLRR